MSPLEVSSGDEQENYGCEIEIEKRLFKNPKNAFKYIKYIEKISVSKSIFFREDLETLLPGNWLTDKMINAYMELLSKYYKNTYFFSSFTFSFLRNSDTDKIANWYKDIKIEKYDSYVFPIHTRSHWSLVLIKNNEFLGFDSLNLMDSRIILRLRNLMVNIFAHQNKKFKVFIGALVKENIPQQRNGDDCGVFCCAYARHYLKGTDHNQFSAEDIPYIRGMILHELLVGEIIYPSNFKPSCN